MCALCATRLGSSRGQVHAWSVCAVGREDFAEALNLASSMSRPYEALLSLPSGRAHSALRAGLMAMNIVPQPLSPDARSRHAQLRAVDDDARRVAFVDISDHKPSLIDLDHALPRGPSRARIFLTRLRGGHASDADRLWVHKLGFGGLWTEFGSDDNATDHALARVATALGTDAPTAAVVKRHIGQPQGPQDQPARELIWRLANASAEAATAALAKRLRVRDREYHLRTYPACFIGRSAVRAIAATFDCSNNDALEIGRALHALGLLVHVTHEHDFEDSDCFYRLTVSRRADSIGLDDALRVLTQGVDVDDRSYHAKTYARCWIGTEAVDLFVGRLSLERHQAWIVLHRLMQFGAFDHVTAERPFIDGHFFYRFAPVLDKALVSVDQRSPASARGPLLPSW